MAESARAIRAVLNDLAASFVPCSLEDLSTALAGADIFAPTVRGKTNRLPSARDLKSAAAFVLLSQVSVYEALAQRTGKLARIDATRVHSWRELHEEYFQQLHGTVYDRLFGSPVAGLLRQEGSPELLRRVVSTAERLLLPLLPERDMLGKIYHGLLPRWLRKRGAVFYTNDAAARLLACLAIRNADALVIDPACGSGALLLAAYSRLVALRGTDAAKGRHSTCLLSQLTGIDVMPFALCLAAASLDLQERADQNRSIRLGVADSTQLEPDSVVLGWEGKARFVVGYHDVVLMNPPFTRGHAITPWDKERLQTEFAPWGSRLGRLAGLQSYFLLLADALLREGGHLGVVLPASTFGTRSTWGLTSFLLSHFVIDLVILCRGRSAFSEQTNLRELLLIGRKQQPSEAHQVTFAVINKSPAQWSSKDVERFCVRLSDVASASTTVSAAGSDLWTRRVPQASLSREPRLFYQHLLQTSSSLLSAYRMLGDLAGKAGLQPFPTVLRRLAVPYLLNPRGSFALGFKALNLLPNREACLKTNDVWFIAERGPGAIRVRNRLTNDAVDLRLSGTIPCVRRLTGLTRVNGSAAIGRTLLRADTPVAKRLLVGTFEKAEATMYSRALAACWRSRVEKRRTHLVMAYKADLGAPGTCLLAAVFDEAAYPAGDAWIFPGLALDEARILALWMNSTFFLVDLLVNRTEQRGAWMRFDKPVLDRLLLLNPSLLSRTQRQKLLNLYARTQLVSVPPLLVQLTQVNRGMVDEGILRILGIKSENAGALAAKSASAALETVSDLVRTMRGD